MASVADLKFEIELQLYNQVGVQPLPFQGMDSTILMCHLIYSSVHLRQREQLFYHLKMIVLSTRQRNCWSICLPCSFSLVILLATSYRPSLSTPSTHCTKLGSNCRIPDPLNVALAKLLPQSHSRVQLCQNA